MLRMRLQRRGKKNYATYRVVIAERRASVKGRFVADLGSYNPHTDAFVVNGEKVTQWLGQGVQPTPTVHNLLVTHGLLKADKVTSWQPKKKQEEAEESEKAEAAKKDVAETKDAKESEESEPVAEKSEQKETEKEDAGKDNKEEAADKS